jgi:hypothetical protein
MPEGLDKASLMKMMASSASPEQQAAIFFYAMRWSRSEPISDASQLNTWSQRSFQFQKEFLPAYADLLSQVESQNSSQLEQISKMNLTTADLSDDQVTEMSAVVQLAFTYLAGADKILLRQQKPIGLTKVLRPLIPVVRLLQQKVPSFKQDMESYVDLYVVELINAMPPRFIVNRVYPSLLAQFLIGQIERVSGTRSGRNQLTAMDVVRDDDVMTPIAIGMDPLDGDSHRHPMGFYYRVFNGSRIGSETQNHSYSWIHQGRAHQAKISARLLSAQGAVKNWPNAVALTRSDRHLVGLVMISPNMRRDIPKLLERYSEYLEDEGFEIESMRSPRPLRQTDIQRLFVSGGIDYMLKEAHSDGDLVNLFRFATTSQLMVARKKGSSDEPDETFYVLYPNPDLGEAAGRIKFGVTPRVFGDWMREREQFNRTPLIYMNSSCWSIKRVFDEISQVHNSAFVNIPSLDTVGIFNHRGPNHMRAFIDGIRSGAELPQIKQLLTEQDYRSKSWTKPTRFLFPHEPDYASLVTRKLQRFIDYSLETN